MKKKLTCGLAAAMIIAGMTASVPAYAEDNNEALTASPAISASALPATISINADGIVSRGTEAFSVIEGKNFEEIINGYINERMSRYVSEGIITQETADEASEYLKNKRLEVSEKLKGMVSGFTSKVGEMIRNIDGITDAEVNININDEEGFSSFPNISLPADAVFNFNAGEITDEAIQSFSINGTEPGVGAGIKTLRVVREFQELVDEGIITEEQMEQMEQSDITHDKAQYVDATVEKLSALIESNTITLEQAKAVAEALYDSNDYSPVFSAMSLNE